MRTLIVILLFAGIALPGFAQKAPRPPVAIPVPAAKAGEEVKKPAPFSEQELRVVRNLPNVPVEKLVELLHAYEKLGNPAMVQIIGRQLIKRNPKHPEALRIAEQVSSKEIAQPPEYLQKVAADLMSGKKVDDPEAVVAQAHALLEANKAKEAVTLLETLRITHYGKGPFPFNEDLASAYHDAGSNDKATALFQNVLKDPQATAESKSDAERELAQMTLEKRIAELRAKSISNPAEGMALADKLLKEHPDNAEAIAFKIESLDRAGRYDEAVKMLEAVKKANGDKSFPYQETLAYAYYGAKRYDEALAAFKKIIADPDSDDEDRSEAQKMIRDISLTNKLERGQEALDRGDTFTAKLLLAELEAEFPNEEEVIGYRAILMAKTGRSKEALELLLKHREKAAREHRVFTLMDSLAEVYRERKEYNLARSAYEDIINMPGFDEDMRAAARASLIEVKREQLIEKANLAIEQGDRALAHKLVDKLMEDSANDPDVKILIADLKLADGHVKEALADFTELKGGYVDKVFPGQPGLADALHHVGRWEEAYEAYSEVLERPGYDAADVWDARWDRRTLLPLIKNHLQFDVNFLSEQEGTAFREHASYSTPWKDNWRAIVNLRNDNISLAESQRFTKRSRINRFEGDITLQRRLEGGYFAEATIGGGQRDVIYGARIGKFEDQGLGWSLGYKGNARSTQSLPLEVLNGREDRVDLNVSGHLHPRITMSVDAYANWVSVGGQRLGSGYGYSGELNYIVQPETRDKPEVAIGYYGEYANYSTASSLPSKVSAGLRPELQVRRALASNDEVKAALPANFGREVFDTLLDPHVSRHGVQITVRKKIDLSLNVFFQGGVYRDFNSGSFEYTFAAGLEYWLNDNFMLYAELRYDSNGLGANGGHSAIEATLGAEMTF